MPTDLTDSPPRVILGFSVKNLTISSCVFMPKIVYFYIQNVKRENQKKMTMLETMAKLDSTDFRTKGKVKFPASTIAVITLCAIIAGGSGYRDFERFGLEKIDWLRTFLVLPDGIPNHDTFRYFWRNLEPARFNACFMEWIDSVSELEIGDGVHIDGKCLRRALTSLGRQPCIVSAYASKQRIVIGQVKADEKSNEITAIPNLLDKLYLAGAIVTIDAAGCQKKIVKKIADKQADYVISLKGNQETIHNEVRELFETVFKNRDTIFISHEETEKGHGRLVTRKCTQTGWVSWFEDLKDWAGLKSFCQIKTTTTDLKTGAETHDIRYFISSLDVNPERVLHFAVKHWSIENPLHWTLDMVFDEDHSRIRTGFGAENIAVMRHFAFDVIRLATGVSGGISSRKKQLTWNDEKMKATLKSA